MYKKLVTPVLLSVLAIFIFSAVSAHASSASATSARTSVTKLATISASASVMAATLLQVPSTSTVDAAKKKKAVAPEPAAWLYVVGAILLVLVVERKALKALFSSSSAN
jgi:hypothetical protein